MAGTQASTLANTLVTIRGNPRACVYTEPLWGLSMNLCLPYASVYMLALGLGDTQIGLVATVYMVSQAVFAFLGGPITDKLGRRKTTAVFDFVAWSIPCLIWREAALAAPASRLWFFLVAALFNGVMKLTTISWDCLLAEDAEKSRIPDIYSLVIAAGQLSVLFAPISSLLVSRLTLVPAIRVLYLNAFIVMTAKLIILYAASRETATGRARLLETKGKSVFRLAAGYRGVLALIARSRGTVFSLVITALSGAVGMINLTFWQVLASGRLGVPDPLLPIFPMLRSLLAIAFLFLAAPRLTRASLKPPLLITFASYFAGQALLILTPAGAPAPLMYAILCASLVFDGFGSGLLPMLAESLVALHVDPQERARVMAIQHVIIMAAVSPFGWIGGALSGLSRALPFALNLLLLAVGFLVTVKHYSGPHKDS